MRPQRWPHRIAGFSILIVALILIGCAKRPVNAPVTAPAPLGSASRAIPATSSGDGPRRAATAPSAAAVRGPNPAEFRPTAALTDIHFDFDKYAIRPEDAKILDQNAAWMKANPNDLILIEGHADERGTNEYNLALGDRRARATKDSLIAQGVQASRLTTISYGEERPLCVEHNEACWAKNRRAHFLVKAQ